MKKLNNCKWFVLGITVCLVCVTMVVPAIAASITKKTAQLEYSGMKITLNGDTVTPKDVNGNVVDPFVIDGTTYLPVRAIGNALGMGVDWDSSTNTVTLSSNTKETNYELYMLYEAGVYAHKAIEYYKELNGLFGTEIVAAGGSTYISTISEQNSKLLAEITDWNKQIESCKSVCTQHGYAEEYNFFNSLGLNAATTLSMASGVVSQAVSGVTSKNLSDFTYYSNLALNCANEVAQNVEDGFYAFVQAS